MEPTQIAVDPSMKHSDANQSGLMNLAARFQTAVISSLIQQTRSFVLGALASIKVGNILISDENYGETRSFGDKESTLTATLVIKSENIWWRVAFGSSMGLAEAFMIGDVDCSDWSRLLEIMILNRDLTNDVRSPVSSLLSTIAGMIRPSNGMSTSLANVRAHYDISNDVFAAFLSPDMTYSCPIWLSQDAEGREDDSLEKAQIRKLHEVIKQARLKPGDHVLEIGTGWGSFAIEAVRSTGCRITSLTLSAEQKVEAEKRIKAAGFESKIEVLLEDYRAISRRGQIFDKVVSIEMMEHVGKDHLEEYFRIVHEVLKRKGGIAVFQSSTMPESRYRSYNEGDDFIRRYIFPGAHVPSASKIMEAAQVGSGGSFVPDRLINLGGHYSKCLREWRENFAANFESLIAPAMISSNPSISPAELEQFKRKFIFYFSICEAGFKTKTLGNILLTIAREGATETLEQIEL